MDRFVSRHGLPSKIYSESSTNSIGACRYLRELEEWMAKKENRDAYNNHSSSRGIRWIFQAPASPHMGGLHEAGVKPLLRKMIGNQPYTERDFNAMFVKIKGVLNSRPLFPASTDANDLEPITPGHFLVCAPLTALPEEDLSELPDNWLYLWQGLRRVQLFWSRWRNEYLSTLHHRRKRYKSTPNLISVLVNDHNLLPQQWPLARIVEIHPGDDGVGRVVTVKTAAGTYKRPAIKMISLMSADYRTISKWQPAI